LKVDVLDIIPRITLDAVDRLIVKLDECARTGSTIDIGEELRHLTLQVISGTFLSLDPKESDATFAIMYLPIVEEGNKRVWSPERSYMFFAPFFWKHRLGVRRLNNYVSSLIVKRWSLRRDEKQSSKTSTRHHDVLDKVLAHYENENPTVDVIPVIDIEQIRDEFKTFMLAGHETSAAMMMWALFELMKNDSLMEKVCLHSS
jgi:cytochrome P450